KTIVTLTADVTGTVTWDNVVVVGNGHSVVPTGSLVIRNSLVTGLSGISGTLSDADIEGSIFEDTGPLNLAFGSGTVIINQNEFRANNRLRFVASDPSVPMMLSFVAGGTNLKRFQGNRVGAGQLRFAGQNWLIGGDTDDQSNILIGPRV